MVIFPAMTMTLVNGLCGIDFNRTNWGDLFADQARRTLFLDTRDICRESDQSPVRAIKIRTTPLVSADGEEMSRVHDEASTECLHLTFLEWSRKSSGSQQYLQDASELQRVKSGDTTALGSASPFLSSSFPSAYFLDTRHHSGVSVCISEFIHDAIPLDVYVTNHVHTDVDMLHLAEGLLDILSSLSAVQIVHRDVMPRNMVVQLSDRAPPRVQLVDFTWAVSPSLQDGVKVELSDHYRFSSSSGQAAHCDVFSMGVVLFEALQCHLLLDAHWMLPLVLIMTDTSHKVSQSTNRLWTYAEVRGLHSMLVDLWKGHRQRGDRSSTHLNKPPTTDDFTSPPTIVTLNKQVLSGHRAVVVRGGDSFRLSVTATGSLRVEALTPRLQSLSRAVETLWGKRVGGLSVAEIGGNHGFFSASSLVSGANQAVVVSTYSRYRDSLADMFMYLDSPLVDQRLLVVDSVLDIQKVDVLVAIGSKDTHWAENLLGDDAWRVDNSSTACLTSLARLLGVLSSKVRKALIVEWIDRSEVMLQRYRGSRLESLFSPSECALSLNASLKIPAHTTVTHYIAEQLKMEYSFENFIAILKRLFSTLLELRTGSSSVRVFAAVHQQGFFSPFSSEELLSDYRFHAWDQFP